MLPYAELEEYLMVHPKMRCHLKILLDIFILLKNVILSMLESEAQIN